MSSQDFTASFTVDQTPAAAFAAVTDVRGWWSGQIEGDTDALGAEFTYRYQDVHYSRQVVTEFTPDRRVVWSVVDSYLDFVEDKEEWTGTEVVFEVVPVDGGTEVRFTHVGLSPAYECFDGCSSAWGFYVTDSLRRLITTGRGEPNPVEEGLADLPA